MAYSHDWEEAAAFSRDGKAVAKFPTLVQDSSGKMVKAEIIKQKGKDGYLVYARTHRKIRNATTQEVDRATGWRTW